MTNCKKHPQYTGRRRKPQASCEACWRLFIAYKDSQNWVKYAQEQLK